jgi:hydroxymethylpyrimidine/phosphomethylpyrimidine kinase
MKSVVRRLRLPIALTIAGSDSGGGAGIQADLKTFTALHCHGTTAITCVTAQNPRAVIDIQPVSAELVRQQITAVFTQLRPHAVKTGMLYSSDIINVIADFFSKGKQPPLVVDPVMVATSGAVLLKPSAIQALKTRLLPLATLITPNLDEAQLLVGRKLSNLEDLLDAAAELHQKFGCAALVKGGHLRLGGEAVDVLFDGKEFTALRAPRVLGVSTHGTGCTYSAAIAAFLAQGEKLPRAVAAAKRFITRAIASSYHAGKHSVLNQLDAA